MNYEQTLQPIPDEQAIDVPLELLDDLAESVQTLRDEALRFSADELRELYGEPSESALERENAPQETVRNLGAIGVIMMSAPEFMQGKLEGETLHVLNGKDQGAIAKTETEAHLDVKEQKVTFAQEREEYKPYADQAAKIVNAALRGNELAYGQLTHDFKELFKVRIASYDSEPSAFEYQAMISTVCIDLYKKDHGGLAADSQELSEAA